MNSNTKNLYEQDEEKVFIINTNEREINYEELETELKIRI